LLVTSGRASLGLTDQVRRAAWELLNKGTWVTFEALNIWGTFSFYFLLKFRT
jgi:hypothetical protein